MPYKVLNRRKGSWLVQVQRNGKRITRRGASGGAAKAKKVEVAVLALLEAEDDGSELAASGTANQPTTRLSSASAGRSQASRTSPLLRDFFETRWAEHAKVVQNEQTRRTSRNPFNYVLYYFGDMALTQAAQPAAVNQFVETMKKNGPLSFVMRRDGTPRKTKASRLKNATINKSLQCLKALLNLAYEEGVLDRRPRLRMLPQDDSEPVLPPTVEEFHTLLEACEQFRHVAPLLPEVVEFTALTGLRKGEVFNLYWRSVELERQVLRVESTLRGQSVNGQAWRPKHGKWREVPLEPAAIAVLERVRPQVPHGPDDPVFPSRGGSPYNRLDRAPDAAGKGYFPDAVREAGLNGKVTFHGLRHLYAVQSLLGGRSISAVSSYLGHSSIELTVKTYGRFSMEAESSRKGASSLARLGRRGTTPTEKEGEA